MKKLIAKIALISLISTANLSFANDALVNICSGNFANNKWQCGWLDKSSVVKIQDVYNAGYRIVAQKEVMGMDLIYVEKIGLK